MRCLEALGQWSQLNNACQTALLDSELAETHLTRQQSETPLDISLSHHNLGIGGSGGGGGGGSSSIGGGIGGVGGILNTALDEYARRQKIAQMAARASWATGEGLKNFSEKF